MESASLTDNGVEGEMRGWMLALAAAGLIAAGTTAAAQETSAASARAMMKALGGGGLEGKRLKKAIEKASVFPLGSAKNPVRVNMPRGERDYLLRLRCSDGAAPQFERGGSTGDGPYGYILDVYSVACPGQAPVEVYMDMYHDEPETMPVPGFSLNG